MTVLNVLLTSVVALGVLINSASPANALVAHGHGLNARSAHSPNHNGFMKRKRSSHKNRKRCVQQQPLAASSSAAASVDSAPSSTDSTPPPAANTPAPANYQANPAQTCGPGAKVGLAWGPTMPTNFIPLATTAKTCWYYNWSPYAADSSLTGSLKFVPMLSRPDDIGHFQEQVINSAANYGIALAMNEVNQEGQAPMDAPSGVSMWNTYLVPLKAKGYTIISPSTTSAPGGIQWIQDWLNGGLQVQPDALALHWYGGAFQDFHDYVELFASTFPNFPIWITEFGCTDFQGNGNCDTMAFANQAIPYLDGNSRVEAYFPFAFEDQMTNVGSNSELMDQYTGALTALGSRYLY